VTVVVTHRVHPNHVDDFLDWQRRMSQEESKCGLVVSGGETAATA
jgi:antibiotic biosynthesis monooxygenase (ABM) superfamily enzyme